MSESGYWRRCSTCKNEIAFQATYWVCNVSTCNRKRTGLIFCAVSCWDAHVPMLRHRESWAEERRSPSPAAWAREQSAEREALVAKTERAARPNTPRPAEKPKPRDTAPSAPSVVLRRRADSGEARSSVQRGAERRTAVGGAGQPSSDPSYSEILVVASKLKDYIKQRSGFSTSDRVFPVLSEALRRLCDEGVRNARREEQKTVMGRDIP